jgi:F-box interacting protein
VFCGSWTWTATSIVRDIKNVLGIYAYYPTLDDVIRITDSIAGADVVDLATGTVLVNCPNKFHEIDHTFGFGRAALSGAYKVIRMARQFCFPDYRYRLSCEILTLGDGVGWRDMPPPQAPVPLSFCRDSPVTINGVVYLLPLSPFHSDDSVFCFDLESEEWKNVCCNTKRIWEFSGTHSFLHSLSQRYTGDVYFTF